MGIDTGYSPDMLELLLPRYYKKLFPYNLFVRWLSYSRAPSSYFSYREFSFTLKDDIYIRFQSFADQADLEKEIQRIQPHKIDIGAVYTHRPREHRAIKSAAFQAVERELIFDIDMTDYDEVRTCCQEAAICARCWPLMRVAVKVIDRALRQDFGFRHLLWVYSGRRGVHCWVGDETARQLSSSARTAVAEYLTLIRGNDDHARKVNLSRAQALAHPLVAASVEIVRQAFPGFACEQQEFMATPGRVRKVLQMLPDGLAKVREALEAKWGEAEAEKEEESTKRWNTLSKYLRGEGQVGASAEAEIMLQFMYPRLDVNVTTGVNHLLKSPFCIHPKTGRVCVPFDARNVDSFDPAEVPTISGVLEELGQKSAETEGKRLLPYKLTSMRDGVLVFEQFVTGLEEAAEQSRRADADKTIDF